MAVGSPGLTRNHASLEGPIMEGPFFFLALSQLLSDEYMFYHSFVHVCTDLTHRESAGAVGFCA